MQQAYYNPTSRQAEKERQRVLDAQSLRNGSVSRGELQQSNGFLASLDIVESSISCKEIFD